MRTEHKTYETVTGIYKKETDKAILLSVDGKEHWLAKSQLNGLEDDVETGDEITIDVATWLCDKVGIDYDNE